jgi:hypothetical protein
VTDVTLSAFLKTTVAFGLEGTFSSASAYENLGGSVGLPTAAMAHHFSNSHNSNPSQRDDKHHARVSRKGSFEA